MLIFRNQLLYPQNVVMIQLFYHLNALLEAQILQIKVLHVDTRRDKTEIPFLNVKCLLTAIDNGCVKQTLG